MKKLLVLLTALMAFSANANLIELDLTSAQSEALFNSLSQETEVVEFVSYGTAIYGSETLRSSGNTDCVKNEYDIEGMETKFHCHVNQ